MASLYRTTKFNLHQCVSMAIWGSTAKFNSHQYFQPYGSMHADWKQKQCWKYKNIAWSHHCFPLKDWCRIIAECFNARQLIPHRILPSRVCVCVCPCHHVYMRWQVYSWKTIITAIDPSAKWNSCTFSTKLPEPQVRRLVYSQLKSKQPRNYGDFSYNYLNGNERLQVGDHRCGILAFSFFVCMMVVYGTLSYL